MPILYVRDKNNLLTAALDREIKRRAESGVPIDDRSTLIREVLWEKIRLWDDPRRGTIGSGRKPPS